MTDMILHLNEWHQSLDKFVVWKQYLSSPWDVSEEMKQWFGKMAISIERQLHTIRQMKEPTQDVRYLDQFYQMKQYVEEIQQQCQTLLIQQFSKEFCRFHSRMDCWDNHSSMICMILKHDLCVDVQNMIRQYLVEWLSNFYYLWKLCKQHRMSFQDWVDVDQIRPFALNDIRLWEVICSDDERDMLCHPCLPHPMDFLERRPLTKTPRYVDKAQFEYQIPHTLLIYPVVLTKTPSFIPRLTTPLKQYEIVCRNKSSFPQELYRETTTRHQSSSKKKRKLSKIVKEQRKRKKTYWLRQRRCHKDSFLMEDEFFENEELSEDSSCDDDHFMR